MIVDLRKELKRLTKEIDRLTDELAVERGEKVLGEMIVMRTGTQWGAPDTFHVTVAISRRDVGHDRRHAEAVVDHILTFTKHKILGELGIISETGGITGK